MRSPVSLEYVIVVTLLAAASGVLAYMAPNPALSLAALLLGIYALHLVSMRIVVRQLAGVGGSARRKGGHANAEPDEIRRLREELEQERAEIENRKTELQQRIVAAEQQWELLRQMIREKVESGATLPDPVAAAPAGPASVSDSGRTHGSDQPPRIHGRW